ncbi:hypothetical protein FCM35_KLT16741 [Carex littledalei]|uniref:Uncharacterized protein n=1 Tax=Carex littledalei TaxID=544730 RepID=A0A833VRV7_9POAL|nr:hypothetical protein FCM35_KLT16741 [Carex littledalei]
MDGDQDYKHTVSKVKSEQSPRRDLLRSYGSAIMTTGERTYKKIEDQDGMIGWLARKFAFVAFPIFWWIRFQWLSQLSFIDRRIQTVEWIASKIIPQSEHIFSKINNLARFADSLPDKLDNVINAIGDFVSELPGLSVFDWAVEVMEEMLKNMMSFIPDFGTSYAEKSPNDDMSLAFERDENLKMTRDEIKEGIKIAEEGLKEGGEILENRCS